MGSPPSFRQSSGRGRAPAAESPRLGRGLHTEAVGIARAPCAGPPTGSHAGRCRPPTTPRAGHRRDRTLVAAQAIHSAPRAASDRGTPWPATPASPHRDGTSHASHCAGPPRHCTSHHCTPALAEVTPPEPHQTATCHLPPATCQATPRSPHKRPPRRHLDGHATRAHGPPSATDPITRRPLHRPSPRPTAQFPRHPSPTGLRPATEPITPQPPPRSPPQPRAPPRITAPRAHAGRTPTRRRRPHAGAPHKSSPPTGGCPALSWSSPEPPRTRRRPPGTGGPGSAGRSPRRFP